MFDSPDGATKIGGAPESYIPFILRELVQKRSLLYVCEDDHSLAKIAGALAFFCPDNECITFPAWDCLPYDRVSPHRDIVAARIAALHKLAMNPDKGNRIVLTSVAALLQRVPAPNWIEQAGIELQSGVNLPPARLRQFLIAKGYRESGTVSEAGEFAQRGGILDLFPPGAAFPIRLDYFGDDIEQIKSFDPLTQRSLEKIESMVLLPVSELELNASSIEQFRIGYRSQLGAGDGDPLYEAASAGRHYPGMEHWLALFRSDLVTLIDYLPDHIVCFSHQAEAAKNNRLETILDFYHARKDLNETEKRLQTQIYRPLPPQALYLTEDDWKRIAKSKSVITFNPGPPPSSEGWVDAGGRITADFALARKNPDLNLYDEVVRHVRSIQAEGQKVILSAASLGACERLGQVLLEHGVEAHRYIENVFDLETLPISVLGRCVLPFERGFSSDTIRLITDQDILGDRLDSGRAKRHRKAGALLTELAHFDTGDFVVHADHGIGRYEGLETLDIGGAPHACLKIIYQSGDKLFVPVENIDILSRYGGEDAFVELDKLGGVAWQARKARVKKRILEIAGKLMAIAADRAVASLDPLQPPEGLYDEFCAGFPYAETEDQLRAIEDVFEDLSTGKPMDRLICGDVGFGKTEVALRAAFVASGSGKQVAVVTPTTLLARQHFNTFLSRFHAFPIRVAQLSRLTGAKQAKDEKQALKEGKVDIVIGTQALLAKDVQFDRLGLVIVDEEQHFGVNQKERLKELRQGVHVLTLTATPIPRTLQMALTGLRDMSLIATPPIDRLAVRTFVLPYDPVILREAMLREHFRGGQIFYVCPRIEDLDKVASNLRDLVPDLKIVMAHGKLSSAQLEKAMSAFYNGEYDLLLSTHIVESGLDIPRANTMIIHRADLFGLAQLYQLRGRIGRSKLRGYCYLTVPAGKVLNPTAERRLEVMQTLDQLGAGFNLASQDLDIRGAGNLLGEEQSGQVREVGVELYQQMLQDAVLAMKKESQTTSTEWSPLINLGMPVLIPETYVADLSLRLALYRRLGELTSKEDVDQFAAEMIDRFGTLPPPFLNLLKVVEIKALCRKANIEKLEVGPKGATIAFKNKRFLNPDKLIAVIASSRGQWSIRPDHRIVYRADWNEEPARVAGCITILNQLGSLVA